MTNSNKYKGPISPEIKAEILNKLSTGGFSVSQLAKDYNISSSSIYHWQKREQKVEEYDQDSMLANFIEMPILDGLSLHPSSLQKASLTFDNFSFTIEGKIKTGRLLQIIRYLEEGLC
jgi:transposase-like protein